MKRPISKTNLFQRRYVADPSARRAAGSRWRTELGEYDSQPAAPAATCVRPLANPRYIGQLTSPLCGLSGNRTTTLLGTILLITWTQRQRSKRVDMLRRCIHLFQRTRTRGSYTDLGILLIA